MARPLLDPRLIESTYNIISQIVMAGGYVKNGVIKCKNKYGRSQRTIRRWWVEGKKAHEG